MGALGRPVGSAKKAAGRKKRVLTLSGKGLTTKEIAVDVGFTPRSVNRIIKDDRWDAEKEVIAVNKPGRPPKIKLWKKQIKRLLKKSPREYGFDADRWTCDRLVKLIWDEYDVIYSAAHVSRLLKEKGIKLNPPPKTKTKP